MEVFATDIFFVIEGQFYVAEGNCFLELQMARGTSLPNKEIHDSDSFIILDILRKAEG